MNIVETEYHVIDYVFYVKNVGMIKINRKTT